MGEAGELVMSLDDESTKEAVEENGTEWVKFWDDIQHTYYYFNLFTNETSWKVPEGVDNIPTKGMQIPPRLVVMLKLQAWLRGRRTRLSKPFSSKRSKRLSSKQF